MPKKIVKLQIKNTLNICDRKTTAHASEAPLNDIGAWK